MLAPLIALLLALEPTESPLEGVAVSFAFEPRVGSYAALDERLRGYGFAPVRSPYLTAFGLRGRCWLPSGFLVELTMTYGIGTAEARGGGVPTVTTVIDSGVGAGYMASFGLFATMGTGFGVLTQSVASSSEGGALVYRAPFIHPRVGYAFVRSAWFGAVSAGFVLHAPIGPAHEQPLWEEPFGRPTIHAFTIGFESGFGWSR
ncbi:MAG: hypothetical protein KUG77_10615 [Nannocystaceae bacterium]|nr:hypothetical protein [Nannocystaceae bacterium]